MMIRPCIVLRWIAAAVLVVSLKATLRAQEYLVHNYTEQDGLASSMVYDATQDSLGRMWFATRAGVSMYDGHRWQTLLGAEKGDYRSISRVQIDERGKVWVLPYLGSLKFYIYHHQGWSILNTPFMANSEERFSFDVAYWDGEPVVALCGNRRGFLLYQDGQWRRPLDPDGQPLLTAHWVVTFEQGFLIATEQGLRYVTPQGVETPPLDSALLPSLNVWALRLERLDQDSLATRVWVAGADWLGYFQAGHFQVVDCPVPLALKKSVTPKDCELFMPDGGQGVYFQRGALFYYHIGTETLHTLNVKSGILAHDANMFFRDRENNIWIGTQRGVSKLASMRFANYRKLHGLLADEVTSVIETTPGHLVFGHNEGLTFFDGRHFEPLPFSGLTRLFSSQARVLDMAKDRQGTVWLACNFFGLAKLEPGRRLSWIGADRFGSEVRSVAVDDEGTVWIASEDKLFTFRQGRLRPVAWASKIRGLRRIVLGDDGTLYIGTTGGGLYVYCQGAVTRYRNPESPNANNIYSILPMPDGRLMLGTMAGLYCLRDRTIEPFVFQGQRIERPVYGLLLDGQGRLWVGTDNGLLRLDETEMRFFQKSQGFVGKEINRDALYRDSSGRLWFGCDTGVSMYQEERDRERAPLPVAKLISLEVNRVKYDLDYSLSLAHDENNWTCNYYGNSFLDEQALTFRILLEGFDKGWVEGPELASRQIRYTNLDPGTYRFRLQVANLEGRWSPVASSAAIVIRQPFWRTPWFYLAVLLSAGGLFYLMAKSLANRRHAKSLEGLVKDRTRELAESEAKYRLIAENPIDGIALVQEGRVIWGNATLWQLFGMPADALLGRPLTHILAVEKAHQIDPVSVCLKNTHGKLNHYEAHGIHSDDRPLDVEIFASDPFDYDGKGTVLCILRDITESKEADRQVRASLKEKDVLLKEIHHRVKNNLQIISSLLSLQSRGIQSAEVGEVFLQSQNRIRTMALLHEKIYQSKDLSRIDYPAYVKSLVKGLAQIYHVQPGRVQICTEITVPYLDIDHALPCGLIINELLSNALKYAFPATYEGKGRVCVGLKAEDGILELEVSDNGVGLPPDFEFHASESLGLRLVHILGEEQLGGRVTVKSDSGTQFILRFGEGED